MLTKSNWMNHLAIWMVTSEVIKFAQNLMKASLLNRMEFLRKWAKNPRLYFETNDNQFVWEFLIFKKKNVFDVFLCIIWVMAVEVDLASDDAILMWYSQILDKSVFKEST